MQPFSFRVVAEDESEGIAIAVAGQTIVDIQNLLTDIGRDMIRTDLRLQNGIPDALLDKFILRTGGQSANGIGTKPADHADVLIDDAMAKAETSGRSVAVFFHSSNNDESRRFKTERMENNRFKTRMRGRLLVVYLDYPNSNNNNPYSDKDSDHDRDKRNKDQIEHNRRIAEKFNVNTYPTVVFLSSSGGEIGRMSGAKSLNGFLDEVEKYVPEKDTTVKNPTGFKIGGSIGMGESRVTLPSD